jgi:hypothetical protein
MEHLIAFFVVFACFGHDYGPATGIGACAAIYLLMPYKPR